MSQGERNRINIQTLVDLFNQLFLIGLHLSIEQRFNIILVHVVFQAPIATKIDEFLANDIGFQVV